MDETLFYIVIFLIYMAFQVLGARKKKKKRSAQGTQAPLPSPKSRPVAQTGAEPTLEDALREIRQALGMQAPAPPKASTPQLPPLPQSRPTPPRQKETHALRAHGPELAETAPKKSWSSEFQAHPTHYADSEFEEFGGEGDRFGKPRPTRPTPRPAPKTKTTAAKLPPIEASKAASTNVSRTKVLRQLQNPKAAQEAFILGEILGPPRIRTRR